MAHIPPPRSVLEERIARGYSLLFPHLRRPAINSEAAKAADAALASSSTTTSRNAAASAPLYERESLRSLSIQPFRDVLSLQQMGTPGAPAAANAGPALERTPTSDPRPSLAAASISATAQETTAPALTATTNAVEMEVRKAQAVPNYSSECSKDLTIARAESIGEFATAPHDNDKSWQRQDKGQIIGGTGKNHARVIVGPAASADRGKPRERHESHEWGRGLGPTVEVDLSDAGRASSPPSIAGSAGRVSGGGVVADVEEQGVYGVGGADVVGDEHLERDNRNGIREKEGGILMFGKTERPDNRGSSDWTPTRGLRGDSNHSRNDDEVEQRWTTERDWGDQGSAGGAPKTTNCVATAGTKSTHVMPTEVQEHPPAPSSAIRQAGWAFATALASAGSGIDGRDTGQRRPWGKEGGSGDRLSSDEDDEDGDDDEEKQKGKVILVLSCVYSRSTF